MKIFNRGKQLTGDLSRGQLSIAFKYEEREPSNFIVKSCTEWIKMTQKEFEDNWVINETNSHLYEEARSLAVKAMRFEDSLNIDEIKNNGDTWYIKFSVNVNGRVSYIETVILTTDIEEYFQFHDITNINKCVARNSTNDVGIVSVDNIITFAFVKLEDKIEEKFKLLDTMLDVKMEENGLRIIFGEYNMLKTYDEWLHIDIQKFNNEYGYFFGKYVSMIKNMIPIMIDVMIEPEPQKITEMSFSKDGKIEIKKTESNFRPQETSKDSFVCSPQIPFNSLDYKDSLKKCAETTWPYPMDNSTEKSIDKEVECVDKSYPNYLSLKIREKTGILLKSIEDMVKKDIDFMEAVLILDDPEMMILKINKNPVMVEIMNNDIYPNTNKIKKIKETLKNTHKDEYLINNFVDKEPKLAEMISDIITEDSEECSKM